MTYRIERALNGTATLHDGVGVRPATEAELYFWGALEEIDGYHSGRLEPNPDVAFDNITEVLAGTIG